jgi:hypothetical protein
MRKNKALESSNADSAFTQLKELLLSDDWHHFQEIKKRVETLALELHDKDQLIETLDPVIADLLERKIHESKPEMAEALAPIMGDAIKRQIADAKEDMVDALYPIVGSMVAKAVQEAMRKMMDEINERLKQVGNTRFIVFVKSKIFKMKPAEILIAEGIGFQLGELFLIEKKSGLLVAYQSALEEHTENDAHILGGMLTAIRQFIKDAFVSDKNGELLEIRHGDRSIRIDSGRYTYLAAVYTGVPPHDFDEQLRELHHRIHNRFYKLLRDFQGETSEFQGVSPVLNRLIKKYKRGVQDGQ